MQVNVDAHTEDFETASFAYYPAEVTLHAGDTVEFVNNFNGNDHTVSTGTLLAEGDAIFAELGEEGEPTPEQQAVLDQLPLTFDEEVTAEDFLAGANPFVQAGMQPCFAAEGDEVPTVEACPDEMQEQPETFTGAEKVYSSGFLSEEDVFTVELDEGLAPGEYVFFCLVHGSSMSTKVTVVDAGEPADTPEDVQARAEEEIAAAVELVRPFAEQTLEITDPTAAFAGPPPEIFEQEDTGPMEPLVFPRELSIAAGESVTWTFTGFHTVSFNAPESARPAFGYQDDGTVGVNREAADSGDAPTMVTLEPPADFDPESGPAFVELDAGTWDGSGFFNSGFPPFSDAIGVWTLTFSTPGTYEYICLIHPDMEGVVNVT